MDDTVGGDSDGRIWLAAVEGFYGEPLAHETRVALVEWLGTEGYDCYAYAPKHDPYHRDRWRDPYPHDEAAKLAEVVAAGQAAGVEVSLAISPGLDWRERDDAPLLAKLETFRAMGARVLGIAFDDVPPGGAELGATHGRAVATAVEALGPEVRWFTCPTDYATPVVTPYLEAFAAELPPEVGIMWTGPSIVSPRVTGDDARRFAAGLGRKPIFAENYPVNDGGMEGVMHLGPYPSRSQDLPAETAGVVCNFMRHAAASRIGLACAARFWRNPSRDRRDAWRDVVAAVPGLGPIALACSMWVDEPGPAQELLEWADAAVATGGADTRLRDYLHAGCRDGLPPELAAELQPWLDAWDRQSHAIQWALQLLALAPARPPEPAFMIQALWRRAREPQAETMGIRWAGYPVTTWDGETTALPEGIVEGENLADRLCKQALGVSRL